MKAEIIIDLIKRQMTLTKCSEVTKKLGEELLKTAILDTPMPPIDHMGGIFEVDKFFDALRAAREHIALERIAGRKVDSIYGKNPEMNIFDVHELLHRTFKLTIASRRTAVKEEHLH